MIRLPGWFPLGPANEDAPGGPIQWFRDPAGVSHVAFAFRKDLRDHPMLAGGVEDVVSFLQKPGVRGVAPLAHWDRGQAVFVYPARDGVLLAQILAHLRRQRRSAGPRAALELLIATAPILDEAVRAGRKVGLPAHGALNPWRVLVLPMGGATLVGHGIPAVEVTAWLDEETSIDPGPALACFPPERIREEDEDLRSDLYALGCAALELLLGRPAIGGRGEAAVDEILAGGALSVAQGLETPALAELFAKLVAPVRTDRFATGRAVAERAAALLPTAGGVSVHDLAMVVASGDTDTLDEDTSVSYQVPSGGMSLPDPEPARGDPSTGRLSADLLPKPIARSAAPAPAPPPTPEPPARPRASEPVPLAPLPVSGPVPAGRGVPEEVTWTGGPLPGRDTGGFSASYLASLGDSDRTDVIGVPLELLEQISASDAHAAPESIPDLGPEPSLLAIQTHAGRIVDRASDLAARALSLAGRVADKAHADGSQEPVARAARAAADRARRAAESCRHAANLLALDEDAAGALITLDLVRNAEAQCESALAEVTAQHRELERFAERVQAQARALQEAARRAAEHADRATDAANQADDLATVLEQEQREGLLSSPGTAELLERAIGAAERAHAAAEEARGHAGQAARADRADLGLRYAEQARRAEEAALQALADTREAAEAARKAEAGARDVAVRRAVDAAARARTASEDAWRALQRADEALRQSASAESRRLRDECAGFVRDAEAAGTEAERALQAARAAERAGEADEAAIQLDRVAARAEEAARRAVLASDKVVRAAGAHAEARARLSKLHEEARHLVERARVGFARSRDDVDRLLDEVSLLPPPFLSTERTTLGADLQAATELLQRMELAGTELGSATEADVVDAALKRLRPLATELGARADALAKDTARVREAAAAELREQEKREEARKEVGRAAQQARESARRCRELVDRAAAEISGLPGPLPGCRELDEVARLRAQAMEIVDIAEFQAGEAAASAEAAAREADPAEARAHAHTAHSFSERIAADLPEAHELAAKAAGLQRRENDAIGAGRARVAEIEAQVSELAQVARAVGEAADREVGAWRDHRTVAAPLATLAELLAGFDPDLNESHWARDQAGRAGSAADLEHFVPAAEGALARARDRRKRVDAQLEAVRRAISGAEAARNAVAEARKSTRTALENCIADLGRVASAQQRLAEAQARHQSAPLEAANAELALREFAARGRVIRETIERVAVEIDGVHEPDAARGLAAKALEHKVEAEILVEKAAEAEARGVAAVEAEARARREAERRRLEAARDALAEHSARAQEAVARITGALAEAEGTQGAVPERARARFDEARRLVDALKAQAAEVVRAAAQGGELSGADAATAAAQRASRAADGVVAEAGKVQQIVQEGLDLARAAAAEENALRSVRDEVRAMGAAAQEAVERAQKDGARVRQILATTSRPELRALLETANTAVSSATNGAAKVRAALPLAEQAASLPIAEATLRAARLALDRAVGGADQLQQLVTRATDAARKEKEDAAAALQDARTRGAQPAQEAAAAASKAGGWSETARREWEAAGSPPSLEGLLKVLDRAVAEVRARAAGAAEAARSALDAPTEETARSLGRDVRQAADATEDASRNARLALDELRAQIQNLRADGDAAASLAAEAAEHAAAANQVADQAEATLAELEAAVDALGPAPSAQIESALLTVRTCATNARFAAATAGGVAEGARQVRRRADAEQAVEEAHRALEDALDALERVVAAEATCRQAIQAHEQRRRSDQERAVVEQRRRQEEAAKRAQEEERSRAAAEEEERRKRDDERRARVERRREERSSRSPAPAAPAVAHAADREALRTLLRESRPSPGPADSTMRPRRRGEPPAGAPTPAPAPARETPGPAPVRPTPAARPAAPPPPRAPLDLLPAPPEEWELSPTHADKVRVTPPAPTRATAPGGSAAAPPTPPRAPPPSPPSERELPSLEIEIELTEDRSGKVDVSAARGVRAWSPSAARPSADRTQARPRPARPAPPPVPGPANDDQTDVGGGPVSEGQKVDALLERLRARRKD